MSGQLQPDSIGRLEPGPPDYHERGIRMTGRRTAKPWERKSAKPAAGTRLTLANVAWARTRAKPAGRRYPNLIDPMSAARRQAEQDRCTEGPDFLKQLMAVESEQGMRGSEDGQREGTPNYGYLAPRMQHFFSRAIYIFDHKYDSLPPFSQPAFVFEGISVSRYEIHGFKCAF